MSAAIAGDRKSVLREYRERGFLGAAIPLADPSVVPSLLADEPLFDQAVQAIQAEGRRTVPYLVTDAIRRVAQDPAILHTVEAVLGTRNWVMWGANIRRATPNAAHVWHVDLESLLWPTVTVAIGLAGCSPQSSTWCLPGTHLLRTPPPLAEADVLRGRRPEQIAGFGDACFYVFDARVWHRGDPAHSRQRVMLFTHYQRASDPRIPLMVDYVRQTFAAEPSPYFTTVPPANVCTDLAQVPYRHRLNLWWNWMRGR